MLVTKKQRHASNVRGQDRYV